MPKLWRQRRPCTLAGDPADKEESFERRGSKVDRSAHQAMPGETAQRTTPINGQSPSQALSPGHALVHQVQRRSPSSPALEAAMMKLQQHKHLLLTLAMPPPTRSTLQVITGAPGDEGHPPVAPRPPPPTPPLAPRLVLLPVHAVPDVDGEGGMGGDPGPGHGRDGVPDLTLGVEEGTEGAHPGGDETGHDRGLTTEKENERGTETGTGTGIGDDTLHADERGPVPAHDRGAARGEDIGAVEAIGGETATATVPLSPPVVPTTVPPLLTEEPRPPPPTFVTS